MNYGVTTRLNQHNRRLLTNTRADRSRNGPVSDTSTADLSEYRNDNQNSLPLNPRR